MDKFGFLKVAAAIPSLRVADCNGNMERMAALAEEAARLAKLAQANGIDGIVCSPMEAHDMRELLGPDALIVTPGVRPVGAALGDQSRVATPSQAIERGASHIVVGRPITGADDPVAAFDAIVAELVENVA